MIAQKIKKKFALVAVEHYCSVVTEMRCEASMKSQTIDIKKNTTILFTAHALIEMS